MGGELTLRSNLGEGSHFTLRVPLELAASAAIQPLAQPARLKATSSQPLRVLVVEDNEINQRVAVSMLEKWGHSAVVAEDGVQAIALFEEQLFDVIFMDRHMPKMDGLEATKRIRKMEGEGKGIAIVGVTAAANAAELSQCLEAGMNNVITKPIEPRQMMLAMAGVEIRRDHGQPPADSDVRSKHHVFDSHRTAGHRQEYGDEFVSALFADFRDMCPLVLETIAEAGESRAYDRLKREVHGLKSNALMLGFTALGEQCNRIENACIDKEFGQARELAGRLLELLRAARTPA